MRKNYAKIIVRQGIFRILSSHLSDFLKSNFGELSRLYFFALSTGTLKALRHKEVQKRKNFSITVKKKSELSVPNAVLQMLTF